MIFRQFVHPSLGHASYLVGSESTGESFVLDVRRDVDGYFAAARGEGLTIRYAADTHQHNDYLSGICELPQRGPVQLLASARAELRYPVRAMRDGDRLEMGEVVLEMMHTPGHTPEHMSVLVRDRDRGEEPVILLSGGALLVADIARPDLLGDAEAVREAARAFCQTLQNKILPLPDFVEVYPTHVAGSLCGGSIGSRYSTTVGYERRRNELLRRLSDEEGFVTRCLDLEGLPAVPPYWRRMRALNQAGPPLLGVLREPLALKPDAFEQQIEEGCLVVDCRPPEAFGGGHIPGSLNVGLTSSFPTWAGTVLPPDRPYLLLVERPEDLWTATWELLRIGYEPPRGWLAGGLRPWRQRAKPLAFVPQWTVHDLARERDRSRSPGERQLLVLDVRQPGEWESFHIPQATHVTGAELPARLAELPRDRPIATICGSGYRSSVAASLLKHDGFPNVFNVLGGMAAWRKAELPVAGGDGRGDGEGESG